jgi:hypothetical protein
LFRNAVHNFVQAILGIHILDRADLEALSEAAASRNRWEFLLMVTPLALPNATGSIRSRCSDGHGRVPFSSL